MSNLIKRREELHHGNDDGHNDAIIASIEQDMRNAARSAAMLTNVLSFFKAFSAFVNKPFMACVDQDYHDFVNDVHADSTHNMDLSRLNMLRRKLGLKLDRKYRSIPEKEAIKIDDESANCTRRSSIFDDFR